jgi:hypothetical protein
MPAHELLRQVKAKSLSVKISKIRVILAALRLQSVQ